LATESTNNLMMRLAKNEYVFGRYVSYDELIEEIDRVTLNEVINASRRMFSAGKVSLTVLGPVERDSLAVDPLLFA
jgi:predicted Zn-dependent peptidase